MQYRSLLGRSTWNLFLSLLLLLLFITIVYFKIYSLEPSLVYTTICVAIRI